jgi:hypothetical protein
MRLLTIAAGLATGYVLGTRAGRSRYEQIVGKARLLRDNPTPGQALTVVQSFFSPASPAPASPAPASAAPAQMSAAAGPEPAAGTVTRPRRPRSAPTSTGTADPVG